MSYHKDKSTMKIPTSTIPNGGVFTIRSEIVINAPLRDVYETILDTSTWPTWCRLVPKVKINHQPVSTFQSSALLVEGTKMTFTVHMNSWLRAISKEQVNYVSPRTEDMKECKICWTARFHPQSLLKGERVHEIQAIEGGCQYVTYETFDKPLAYIVKLLFTSPLQNGFDNWCIDLKNYCEAHKST